MRVWAMILLLWIAAWVLWWHVMRAMCRVAWKIMEIV